MKLTVFTPAYNRGYIIENLYRSLQRQTFHDFEWVVFDDGSTDNTEVLFLNWLREENFFNITYLKVKNGGKHRAINKGVQMAKGEMFFIVDSDDYLPDDALEHIAYIEKGISEQEKLSFCGVCGKRAYSATKDIGTSFEGDFLDITSLERGKYGIYGDKAEVFYTSVLRKYPFPEIEGENFLTECIVWNRMAQDGWKLRFFNQAVYLCQYREDGLTAQGKQIFYNNPIGWGIYIRQVVELGMCTGFEKWSLYLEYFEVLKKKMKFSEIARNLGCSPIPLYNRLFWMRVFYRLYS